MKRDDGRELTGQTFDGRFKIEGLLGAGGMGRVYRGVQLSIGRPVALKVLHEELARDERQVERFNREALACSRLTHPNSIRILDYGRSEDGNLFLVMEYLDGHVLSRAIREAGPMDPKRVVHIASQIAKALAEAHDVGLVHRDLKPANIMLCDFHGERDFVKVLDYGIAKFTASSSTDDDALTKQGSILGTPDYLAPEQALGLPVTAQADLYALGVIMYHMLSGRTPFQADTPVAVVMKHIHEAPTPFGTLPGIPPVPAVLETLVFELLTKNPNRRPGSAAALARRLDAMLSSQLLDAGDRTRPPPRKPARRVQTVTSPGPSSRELMDLLDDGDDLDLGSYEADGPPEAQVVGAVEDELDLSEADELDLSEADELDLSEADELDLSEADELDLSEADELDLSEADELDLSEANEPDGAAPREVLEPAREAHTARLGEAVPAPRPGPSPAPAGGASPGTSSALTEGAAAASPAASPRSHLKWGIAVAVLVLAAALVALLARS